VAEAIAQDADTWNEATLGKTSAEYQQWIRQDSSWGGGIELSILCEHFGIQIHAADIQTCRVDRYGQDKGYSERILLLYDGLHYDALAVAPFEGAPEEFDMTRLPLDGLDVDVAFTKFVKAHHDAHRFTNTSTFTLRCLVCRAGLVGEKEAAAHARSTGHTSYGEYHS
jgi:ubiquitin thioesterase OTU1